MESNPLPNRVANEMREMREQMDSQWWRDEKNRSCLSRDEYVHPNEHRLIHRIGSRQNSVPLDPMLGIFLFVTFVIIVSILSLIFN